VGKAKRDHEQAAPPVIGYRRGDPRAAALARGETPESGSDRRQDTTQAENRAGKV
jgi:hypothetical protein